MKKFLRLYRFLKELYLKEHNQHVLSHRYKSAFHSTTIYRVDNDKNVSIGNHCEFGAYSLIYCFNEHPEKNNSFLTIGEHTFIGEFNNIRACGGSIAIGKHCLISQNITIVASNHGMAANQYIQNQAWSEEKNYVIIEDDVWIGAGAIILPGTILRKGCIVAAGSLVNKEFPSNSIIAGIPAKLIKEKS